MKKCICLFVVLAAFLAISVGVAFGEISEQERMIRQADEVFLEEGLENYTAAIDLYKEVISKDPNHFEAHWKLARALREYAQWYMMEGTQGYEEIAVAYGKEGMSYAQRAIDMNPEHPGGHLYYGINVGKYSDGVGIITALREGLKDKTQSSFEKAYELDPHFENGAAILSLGRFWQVVPWPFRDTDKAEAFYREFQNTEYYTNNVECRMYLAELLKGKWGSRHNAEARKLLEEVLELETHIYWHNMAREMLKDL